MLVWQRKSKRKEGLQKALSEREIQEKLYGTFRAGGAFVKPEAMERSEAPSEAQDLFRVPHVKAHGAAQEAALLEQEIESDLSRHPESPSMPVLPAFARLPNPAPARLVRRLGLAIVLALALAVLAWILRMVVTQPNRAEERVAARLDLAGVSSPAQIAIERKAEPAPLLVKPAARETSLGAESEASAVGRAATPLHPAPSAPSYAIQVCIYESQARSQLLKKELAAQGFEAWYDKRTNRSGHSLYRVYVGRYPTYATAQKALRDFLSSPFAKRFPDSFVLKSTA